MLAVALVAANLSAAPPAPLLYAPEVLLAVLALGLLVAILAGGIGFFVSLRASTAQEAQQLTGVGMMLPLMLASFLLMAVMGNDDLREMLAGLGSLDPRLLVVTVMAAITIIDGALLVAADRRFRRGRLLAR
jgi:ABC-type Na+ efflux pump permease subunit